MKQRKHKELTLFDVAQMGENACKEFLALTRWNGKPVCPYCAGDKCYKTKTRFKCAGCKKLFSVTVGTIFHDSKIPLYKWFMAVYFIVNHKKGISSCQLAKDIQVTQRTAWFMLHRVRNSLIPESNKKLSKTVEVDETYVGGKNKNRHWDKKVKYSQGRSTKDKTPVFGMLQRGGEIRAQAVKNTKAKTLQPIIFDNIKRDSNLMSDEWLAYNGLYKYFRHQKVYLY